jgi:N utilization substance protein B
MLFQIDLTGGCPEEVFPAFWSAHQPEEALREFSESLVQGVVARRDELDEVIEGAASHWRIDRMAAVDRNVLRLATYEMLHGADTPKAVVIDEAIEVAKKFGGEESGAFINGVLDSVARRILGDEPRVTDGDAE